MIRKAEYFTSFFLIIMGFFLISSFLVNVISNLITEDWVEINAYVIDRKVIENEHFSKTSGYKVSEKYELTILYFVNDIEYTNKIITTVKTTAKLLITVNPKNADEINVVENTKQGFPLIINLIGFLLSISGFILLGKSIYYSIHQKRFQYSKVS